MSSRAGWRPQQLNVFDVNNTALSYSGIYDYDGSGNIKAMGGAKRYRYDGVSRLVESKETWGATTYIQKPTFDSYGNIQSMETGPSGGTTVLNTPTSASTNRLTSAGTVYDAVGNMTSWNGGAQYDYDRLNRMRRFRGSPTPGSEEWVFAYTASDERVLSLRVGGSGRIWSLRGLDGTLLREWRSESSVQSFKDYIWTGRHLVAKVERTPNQGFGGAWTETTIHAATDHLGSVRTYTDAAGLALPGHIYYPFGQQLNGTQDGERIKYTGHERDLWNTPSSADDLDYMHARHYNPQIGRFLQVDALRGSALRPQSMNRYGYVSGNPVSRNDPTGQHEDAPLDGVQVVSWTDICAYGCMDGVDWFWTWFFGGWGRDDGGLGGDQDSGLGNPTNTPTTPIDPTTDTPEKPEKPEEPTKEKDPCLGPPIQVSASIPVVWIPPLLGLFGGVDLTFFNYRDGSTSLYVGVGLVALGSGRVSSPGLGNVASGDATYQTASDSPRGAMFNFSAAGGLGIFGVAASSLERMFDPGTESITSVGPAFAQGLSASVTGGYHGQVSDKHPSCK